MSIFGDFLVQMQENADQKKSKYGHFSQSVTDFKSFWNLVTHNSLNKCSLSTDGNNKQNRLTEC